MNTETGGWRRGFARRAALLITVFVTLSTPAAAFAHGDEGMVPARDSVLQAIAYLVNTPDDMDMIKDKVKDAQESTDHNGVDVSQLDDAMSALEAGNMTDARVRLERAIGARVDLSGTNVEPVLQVPPGLTSVTLATGDQPGTTVVTDELAGRSGSLAVGDVVLIGLAALAVAVGIALSMRFRPEHSIHTLRRQAAGNVGA
ncbi:MAG TPA: hypothetical protein VFJ22_04110 [Dermatophilaceae bacterium]|nr:hypothetical protein [Dermatophilaceae bacterium]